MREGLILTKNKLKQKLYASGVKSAVVADSVAEVDDYSSCLYHAEKYLRNKINWMFYPKK